MKKKQAILKVFEDENGNIQIACPNRDDAVMAVTDYIHRLHASGDQSALDVLFAITVHLLAIEQSGKFEEEYIENLRKYIPPYRKIYADVTQRVGMSGKDIS